MSSTVADPPFSADEIRAATGEGRTYRFRVETPEREVEEHVIAFSQVDDAGAVIKSVSGDQARTSRVTWTELLGHASYPKASTTISDAAIEVPAGKFDCMLYVVEESRDGATMVTRAYFARSLPGAPIKHIVERDGQVISTMTLLAHEPGRRGPASASP